MSRLPGLTMQMPPDYHLHTVLCRHATGTATEYAAQAARLGLTEIGFSEHNPMVRDDFDDWRMRRADLDTYVAQVEQARRDHPNLTIRLALEMDYIPGQEEWIRELAGRQRWDYLIGSVHYILDDWDFDNPAKRARWQQHEPWEIWSNYFDRLTQAVETGLFDIVGHADLCKKFGVYPERDRTPLYRRLLEATRRRGMAMELNTAGLRKPCREIYPEAALVRLAAELGVPITFGSDAHAPGEVGTGWAEAVALARSAGHTHYCRYQGRKREMVRLGE